MKERYNPDYIHHKDSKIITAMKEIVFGMEDGMVSTLGAITGIAVGSQDHFMILLSGMVIISVESISMGIGSYISNKSELDILKRKLYEEKQEIADFPNEEKEELLEIYLDNGWPKALATKMSEVACQDKDLMFNEMAYHELNISPNFRKNTWHNSVFMFVAYVIGGFIPLFAYFVFPINIAIKISIIITLLGLFTLGAVTTKYTKGNWLRMGMRILLLGGIALVAGYFIGKLASLWGI